MKSVDEKQNHKSLYSDDLADRLLEKKTWEARERSRRLLRLSAAQTLAMSVSVSSIFVLLFDFISNTGFIDTINLLVPLGVSFVGLLAAIFIFFYREKERAKNDLNREIYYLDDEKMRLIREWIAFERLSREFLESQVRQNAPQGLAETIEILSGMQIIGAIDRGILISALKSRNSIVHSGSSGLSTSEEALLRARLSEINEKLFTFYIKESADQRR